MKQTLFAIGLVAAALFIGGESEAGQFETIFEFRAAIGWVSNELMVPTPPGYYIPTPSALSLWKCRITEAFISDDGSQVYRNLACSQDLTGDTVGFSVACSRSKSDFEKQAVFLRNGKADMNITGGCVTRPVGGGSKGASPSTTHL